MKIAIACDHAGFELKQKIVDHLKTSGHEVIDLGTDSNEPVDYPVYGKACGEAVASGEAERGIVVCGSGIGISIAANKVKGVRCALCTDVELARMSRLHNNANVLAMGGRVVDHNLALEMTDVWLETAASEEERHVRRVNMLNQL